MCMLCQIIRPSAKCFYVRVAEHKGRPVILILCLLFSKFCSTPNMKPHAQDTPRTFNSKLNVDKNRACVLCCSQGPRMIPCKFPTKCLRCFSKRRFGSYSVATKPPFDFDQPVWSLPCLLTKCHCDFYDGPTCLKWFLYKMNFTSLRYKILDLDFMSPLARLKRRPV